MRERGCSDRPLALTAWEDGGRAVLQVEAAPPKFGGVRLLAFQCQRPHDTKFFPHPAHAQILLPRFPKNSPT